MYCHVNSPGSWSRGVHVQGLTQIHLLCSLDGDAGCRRGDPGCSSHTECLGWQRSVFTLVFSTVLREIDAAAQWSWLIEDER